MTPAPPQLAPPRARIRAILTAALGVVLLAALFLPARDPVTHSLAVEWRPSAELAGVLFLIAMTALVSPRLVARRGFAFVLALLVVGAALLNLADAAIPSLLGRDLSLYWDLQHVPSLFGLARDSAGLWSASVATALLFAAVSLVVTGAYWIWRSVLATLADRRIAIGAAVLLGVALDVTSFLPAEQRPLATALGADIVRHAAGFERGWRAQAEARLPLPAALASSGPPGSTLTGLKRRDVYLVYIESYGTTVFDTPEFRSALRGSLSEFESSLRAAGYTMASNRLVSPTFGGRSWLAHATLASGVRLDDPLLYSQLLRSGRKMLPGYFKDAGWRAIEIMPGIKTPDPEARAWGFDRDVYAAELGYHGPSFGWFAIPDQFTLERAAEIREALGSETPVFTQIVLVSSHIPFSPVPPYLADWRDAGAFSTVPSDAWEEIFRPPDWTVLTPGYLKSLKYDFAVLGDWLAKHLPGTGLIILLGDHQPPVVGGEIQQWTVPVHVLSRDPDLVAPFVAAGYVAGLVPPPTPPPKGMETFLPSFLAAFDRSD
ncbi:MAG TPA: hypothetical protein VH230_07370 [Stellaceae bacterium]|nr:hypothetical protein [Stellaceae bacterium]